MGTLILLQLWERNRDAGRGGKVIGMQTGGKGDDWEACMDGRGIGRQAGGVK